MIDIDKAFAEVAPPAADAHDPEAARRIWLRARVTAPVANERLRFASMTLFMAALDAIAVLLVVVAVHA